MNNRLGSNLFLLLTFMLSLNASANAAPRDLLVHGSSQMYWIAVSAPDASNPARTFFRARAIGGAQWKLIGQINGHVVSIADRGQQLAVLLENGDWMFLWENGSSTGILPEDGTKLLTLAGGADSVWAIASARSGRNPTTAGATQPAAALTANTLILSRLDRGHWTMLAPLPTPAQQARDVSLMVHNGTTPLIAVLQEDGQVRIFQWSDTLRAWEAGGVLQPRAPGISRIKLLSDADRLALWAGDDNGNGELFLASGQQWSAPVRILLPGDVAQTGKSDVTLAGRSLRVVVAAADGNVVETSFSLDGKALPSVVLPVPSALVEERPFSWLSAIMMTLLLVVLMNTMRRGGSVPLETIEAAGMKLAPLGLRALAGAIDAFPFIGTLALALVRGLNDPSFSIESVINSTQAASYVAMYIALAIYILHTTVSEALWGWTIGKKLFGLRVANLKGSKPSLRSVIVRNLLRVIDVATGFPILLVFISPLHQRVGDIAAETIVIRANIDTGNPPQ